MTDYNPLDNAHSDRVEQRNHLSEDGMDPYPSEYDTSDCRINEFTSRFSDSDVSSVTESFTLCGRVTRHNDLGGIRFIDIRDASGTVQLIARDEEAEQYELLDRLNLGDIISATGTVGESNSGQLSLIVSEWEMMSKTLRHPPWASHESGFDEQNRSRERTAALQLRDLNNSIRTRFEVQETVREYLNQNDFLEVETPIIHDVSGGADATPFETYVETLDTDAYLRIAPELYLKRLLVGGFDQIYEMGRDFRNEDVDTSHNPEFTMLEVYQSYADYEDMMELTRELVEQTITQVTGSPTVTLDGTEIDFSAPWERVTLSEAVERHTDIPANELAGSELIRLASQTLGCDEDDIDNPLMELYDSEVEDELTHPTFVTQHPRSSTPLCEPLPEDDSRLQRFELVVNGIEIANAYTELRDPVEQAAAFDSQAGDDINTDFINDLLYGMPPAAGLGIGIDRLAMIAAETSSIKDVIAFPMSG